MIIESYKAICENCFSADAIILSVDGVFGNPVCPHCSNTLEAPNDGTDQTQD
jgi:hypothetical protein